MAPRIPGLGWYALAGLALLAGLGIAAALVWRFVAAFEPPTRFLAPGAVEVSLPAPGEYILWHEHRTLYEGRSYDVPPPMPDGARFRVRGPDGESNAVTVYGSMRSEGSEGRSVSVGRFETVRAGVHRIAIEGSFEPRVVAVGPNRTWPILRLAAQAFAVVVLAFGLAMSAALYGFLQTVEAPAGAGEAHASLRKLTALVYGLQAASLILGVTLFAGVIVNYLRRRQAAGTWLESHFTWQIRTFWWSLLWCVVGVASLVVVVGFVILPASAIWFVYRVVKGWTELNEGRPMYR